MQFTCESTGQTTGEDRNFSVLSAVGSTAEAVKVGSYFNGFITPDQIKMGIRKNGFKIVLTSQNYIWRPEKPQRVPNINSKPFLS